LVRVQPGEPQRRCIRAETRRAPRLERPSWVPEHSRETLPYRCGIADVRGGQVGKRFKRCVRVARPGVAAAQRYSSRYQTLEKHAAQRVTLRLQTGSIRTDVGRDLQRAPSPASAAAAAPSRQASRRGLCPPHGIRGIGSTQHDPTPAQSGRRTPDTARVCPRALHPSNPPSRSSFPLCRPQLSGYVRRRAAPIPRSRGARANELAPA
jgi:hypothetical protein